MQIQHGELRHPAASGQASPALSLSTERQPGAQMAAQLWLVPCGTVSNRNHAGGPQHSMFIMHSAARLLGLGLLFAVFSSCTPTPASTPQATATRAPVASPGSAASPASVPSPSGNTVPTPLPSDAWQILRKPADVIRLQAHCTYGDTVAFRKDSRGCSEVEASDYSLFLI
jgi:hypothetical protein